MYSNASLGTTVVGSVMQVIPTMGNEVTRALDKNEMWLWGDTNSEYVQGGPSG